jgi:hypothetical protein
VKAWENPRYALILSSLGAYAFALAFMHSSCINGSDVRAQIYGGQVFPDPPDHSTFNGGGGGVSGIGDNVCAHLDGPSFDA